MKAHLPKKSHPRNVVICWPPRWKAGRATNNLAKQLAELLSLMLEFVSAPLRTSVIVMQVKIAD